MLIANANAIGIKINDQRKARKRCLGPVRFTFMLGKSHTLGVIQLPKLSKSLVEADRFDYNFPNTPLFVGDCGLGFSIIPIPYF